MVIGAFAFLANSSSLSFIYGASGENRSKVAKKRKMSKKKVEVKRFRSEARACRVGDPSQKKLCKLLKGKCRLCTAIRTGFKYSLEYKRNRAKRGDPYVHISGIVMCYFKTWKYWL
jgi:hypothetical protein